MEQIPVACAAMQQNPATDWMYTADPGQAGLGLVGRRVPVPRGKMLGSSGLNYMAYVRGHPGDFDSWAEGGATGWSYAGVLPYFRKSEGLTPSEDIVIDPEAHNQAVLWASPCARPFSRRRANSSKLPSPPASRAVITMAATAADPPALASLMQTSTERADGRVPIAPFSKAKRSAVPNLTIITGAQAKRVILRESSGNWPPPVLNIDPLTVRSTPLSRSRK